LFGETKKETFTVTAEIKKGNREDPVSAVLPKKEGVVHNRAADGAGSKSTCPVVLGRILWGPGGKRAKRNIQKGKGKKAYAQGDRLTVSWGGGERK